MPVEYEVNLQVDATIVDEYLAWLRAHIAELLALPGFVDAQLSRIHEPVSPGRVAYCVRYRLHDRTALDAYLEQHAARMRAQGIERFGGRFEASRRILEPLDAGPDA